MTRFIVFALVVCTSTVAQGPREEEKAQLAGVIRSATTGEPLKSVLVSLRRTSERRSFLRNRTSGPEGGFVFSDLASGEYSLVFRKTGYRTLRGTATKLALREKQKANDLTFNLWPTGAISGLVLDPDGEAVPQAQVRAYGLVYREAGLKLTPAGTAQSDDRGEYRIYGLAAGKYLIGVQPPAQGTPAGEYYANTAGVFYPATLTPENALPLKVTWGQELADIDLELTEGTTYSIVGSALDAKIGGPCTGCVVRLMRVSRSFWLKLSKQSRTGRDGGFVIPGLGTGTHKIVAEKPGADEVVSQRTVEISDRDVRDVGLMVGRGVPVGGKVVFEGSPEFSGGGGRSVSPSIKLESAAVLAAARGSGTGRHDIPG